LPIVCGRVLVWPVPECGNGFGVPISTDSATIHVLFELPKSPVKRGELLSLLIELGVTELKVTGSGSVDFELYGRASECFAQWQQIATFVETD
jgi:hypothetical protein